MVRDRGTDDEQVGSGVDVGGDVVARRSYLKATVATLTLGLGTTAGTSQVGYESVLDAVDDLDCDPRGSEAVQTPVEDALESDTAIYFPEGRYLISGTIDVDVDDVGLFGDDGAEFVVDSGHSDELLVVEADDFVVDGLDVDQTDEGAVGYINVVGSGFEIRNVDIYGDEEPIGDDASHNLNVHVDDPDGVGHVENVNIYGLTQLGTYRDSSGGIRASTRHHGTLFVDDVYVENRANNGMYCSRTNGPVIVRNSEFKNNNGSSVRLGHPDSRVEGCTIAVDLREIPEGTDMSTVNFRGVRFESDERNEYGAPGGTIARDCTITVESTLDARSKGAITVHERYGSAVIEDCRIEINDDTTTAIHVDPPVSGVDHDTSIEVRGTTISGSASDGTGIYVSGRPHSTVDESWITFSGAHSDGVVFVDSPESAVRQTRIDVTGTDVQYRSEDD